MATKLIYRVLCKTHRWSVKDCPYKGHWFHDQSTLFIGGVLAIPIPIWTLTQLIITCRTIVLSVPCQSFRFGWNHGHLEWVLWRFVLGAYTWQLICADSGLSFKEHFPLVLVFKFYNLWSSEWRHVRKFVVACLSTICRHVPIFAMQNSWLQRGSRFPELK